MYWKLTITFLILAIITNAVDDVQRGPKIGMGVHEHDDYKGHLIAEAILVVSSIGFVITLLLAIWSAV